MSQAMRRIRELVATGSEAEAVGVVRVERMHCLRLGAARGAGGERTDDAFRRRAGVGIERGGKG